MKRTLPSLTQHYLEGKDGENEAMAVALTVNGHHGKIHCVISLRSLEVVYVAVCIY